MIELLIWALLGTTSGMIFGMIPSAGVFTATAVLYPLLLTTSPENIMMYYIAILIAENYSNSITSILYGIPGDATAVTTAKIGYRFYRRGYGNIAVSTTVLSSTIGVLFAIGLFLFLLPLIIQVFNFYNSILQTIVIGLAIVLIVLYSKQNKFITILLFLLGGILAHIGVNPITYENFATFGNPYLSLGIPFGSIMVGLYLVPEMLKNGKLELTEPKTLNRFSVGNGFIMPSFLGSFIGFWCGLVPGITNILGSQMSATVTKKLFKRSYLKTLSAAESANNSGALSSLLPLLILAIPITGSEVLVYYLMADKGFIFNIENTINSLYNIIYFLPFVTVLTLYISWYRFSVLGRLVYLYKDYRNWVNIGVVLVISVTNIIIYPIHSWMLICIMFTSIIGYVLKRFDTVSIIYGFFLSDLFYANFVRTITILF